MKTINIIVAAIFLILQLNTLNAGKCGRERTDLIGFQANFYQNEGKYCLYYQNQEDFKTNTYYMMQGETSLIDSSPGVRCEQYEPLINGECRNRGFTSFYYQQDYYNPYYQSYFGQQSENFFMVRKSKQTSSTSNQIDGMLLVPEEQQSGEDSFLSQYREIVKNGDLQQTTCASLLEGKWVAKALFTNELTYKNNCVYDADFNVIETPEGIELFGFSNSGDYASFFVEQKECPLLRVSYQGKCNEEQQIITLDNYEGLVVFSQDLIIVQTEYSLVYLIRQQ